MHIKPTLYRGSSNRTLRIKNCSKLDPRSIRCVRKRCSTKLRLPSLYLFCVLGDMIITSLQIPKFHYFILFFSFLVFLHFIFILFILVKFLFLLIFCFISISLEKSEKEKEKKKKEKQKKRGKKEKINFFKKKNLLLQCTRAIINHGFVPEAMDSTEAKLQRPFLAFISTRFCFFLFPNPLPAHSFYLYQNFSRRNAI